MPASRSAKVETSNTKKVLDALITADDFIPIEQVALLAKLSVNSCRSPLRWLQIMKAIDAVEVNGKPWWFATPDLDTRSKTIDEHRKEDEPRKSSPRPYRRKVD